MEKLLQLRNNSILAHGFQPIGRENYEKLLPLVEELAEMVVPSLTEKEEEAEIPSLQGLDRLIGEISR